MRHREETNCIVYARHSELERLKPLPTRVILNQQGRSQTAIYQRLSDYGEGTLGGWLRYETATNAGIVNGNSTENQKPSRNVNRR